MKVKTKLAFGITFLFAAFLIVGGSGLYFMLKVSQQNLLIMKDNHLSLEYTENMLQAIDHTNSIQSSFIFNRNYLINLKELSILLKTFEQNLYGEANNISEIGEKEKVQLLKTNFDKYKTLMSLSIKDSLTDKGHFYFVNILPTLTEIKSIIFAISDMNMQAIVRKNDAAKDTINHSYLVLSAITSICFLVFFFFIFSFPTYIANPIRELTESVREITNRNFTARVHFASNDEFGEISDAFNTMASKLEEFDESQKKLSLHGKEREEAVMDKIQEALILLDESQNITFINTAAENILGLNRFETLNKYAPDIEVLRPLINNMDLNRPNQEETIILEYHGKKTKFIKETTMIITSSKEEDRITPIGHMIFFKNANDNYEQKT